MPDRQKVIIYVTAGPSRDRQAEAVADLCRKRGYQGVAQAHHPEDAARLVAGGLADLVVAAFDPRDGLRAQVADVGGEIEFVRQPREPVTVRSLFERMKRRGRTTEEIARLHELDTTDVRAILRRGDQPRRRRYRQD